MKMNPDNSQKSIEFEEVFSWNYIMEIELWSYFVFYSEYLFFNLSQSGFIVLIGFFFSVIQFAREMGVSKTILYEKMKALIGQTPNDFLKVIRMKAVELLREDKYSINEIATLTGFDDPVFSTCFKKQYGKSPSKYFEK